MIKNILKFLAIFILFLEALIIFLPKENLYFLALQEAKEHKVFVQNKTITDNYFSFELKNSTISYEGVQAATIENFNISTYLFSSKLKISNIFLDDLVKQFLPSRIKTVQISHSILDPLNIHIKANLIQAKAYGIFSLKLRKFIIYIKPSKQFLRSYKKLLRGAKKQKNGEYKIEYQL